MSYDEELSLVLPTNYCERVYAGVLGKIIGVYLGRPFEGWWYDRIISVLGEVNYYVNEKLGTDLIVTDDDISGTFTFIRALADNGFSEKITPAEIGWTWLNYIIENKAILWWGGIGVSTEHTAFLRLKSGVEAPESGSIKLNGKVVAEQIGAQIFIDGWGMVCPGDPEKAAALAKRAGSVSHDGEAVYAAQVIAAMEALAFVESSPDILLDTAASLIPGTSLIYKLINDVRDWHHSEPDWRETRARIASIYGYDKYGGGCHVVPNHALIIMGLLYGADDFQRALMITNTSGWDTDCNSANIGCLMGIRLGLDGIDKGVDWRGPVADRLYLPTADGGRSISDAVRETYEIVNIARGMNGLDAERPKDGARYHFTLPGSVQGFMLEDSEECRGTADITNVGGHSAYGTRSLKIAYRGVGPGRRCRVQTGTFASPKALAMGGYSLLASPKLYSGQVVKAGLSADAGNSSPVNLCLYIRHYNGKDELAVVRAVKTAVQPGESLMTSWTIPDTGGQPIAEIGIEIEGPERDGNIYLDLLTWGGVPETVLGRPSDGGAVWNRAWVNATDNDSSWWVSDDWPYDIVQNKGLGLRSIGESCWKDYIVSTRMQAHLATAAGLAVNYRGLFRYTAVWVTSQGLAQIVQRHDGTERILAEAVIPWELDRPYGIEVSSSSDGTIKAEVDGVCLEAKVEASSASGGVAFVAKEGHIQFGPVRITPLKNK